MRPRPLANPPNPWHSTSVEYDLESGMPDTQVHVFEDATKKILAHNDSPDLGFSWSVNPYRGCMHACAYCLAGDTRILMGDGRTRRMADLRVGDEIYGTAEAPGGRRFVRTTVLNHWRTTKRAFRVRLADGTELVTSAEHRFLGPDGWRYVRDLHAGEALLGCGRFVEGPADTPDYRAGYLVGLVSGDGLADLEALLRARAYLLEFEAAAQELGILQATPCGGAAAAQAVRIPARDLVARIRRVISWPGEPTLEWRKGFIAGLFDAEGIADRQGLRIVHRDLGILREAAKAFSAIGLGATTSEGQISLDGGVAARVRFFAAADPAITRTRSLHGLAVDAAAARTVHSVTDLGVDTPLYDMTTGTSDFVAEGVISHNCYARPSHEYLGFGAGTDFDTKIVVKKDAPELLRDAFDAPSWKGELVMFSGVTDCYQPLESSLKLTRGCLEVCAEYQNPVGVITKSPLVERDVDLLARPGVTVTVSIPFWDAERARAIEPWVATPQRRMKAIARLAEAGVSVGVNVAPIIPGLNDEDISQILTAAREAGARHCGMTLVRLPGSVREVFEQRVRAGFPLAADKILHRIRTTRGGRLYDPRFGKRMQGEGEYADTIQSFFDTVSRKLGFVDRWDMPPPATFRRPDRPRARPGDKQLTLF